MTATDAHFPAYTLRPDPRVAAWAEPTLDDLMSDPLIRKVMRADRVDAAEMQDLLGQAAGRLRKGSLKPRAADGKFDPLTARWFPRPLRVDASARTAGVTAAVVEKASGAVVEKGSKSVCGTPCQW
jgi:hypothetical protein